MATSIWFWLAFHAAILGVLAIDLFGFNRRAHVVSWREAGIWSAIWVALSLGFNALVWHWRGAQAGLDFFTGYVIEYSLSVDNIFVFVLIFSYFKVRAIHQHRVLVWGILGALILRGLIIWLGVALVERFEFVLYVFGLFLLVTGIRMLVSRNAKPDLSRNLVLRLCRKWLPITEDFHGRHFIARECGRWMATPLLFVLILIDVMDLVFAVDSIPAVFAITRDEFVIYTSNICAVLGLRSMYFLLADLVDRFAYLKSGLAVVLAFVGIKMLAADFVLLSNWLSLFVILAVLAATILLSIMAPPREKNASQ